MPVLYAIESDCVFSCVTTLMFHSIEVRDAILSFMQSYFNHLFDPMSLLFLLSIFILKPLGIFHSVVVKAYSNTPALDADTVFFKKDRKPFGKVSCLFFLSDKLFVFLKIYPVESPFKHFSKARIMVCVKLEIERSGRIG